jgi:predicted TIM-barrel fold metal-dependent hydrolase
MRVVNAHAHIGDSRIWDVEMSEDELLATMDQHGVDVSLVMPSAGCRDAAAMHDRIAALGEAHPGRITGIVHINPHTDRPILEAEARRCVEDLGFVGIKIHPLGYGVDPRSRDAEAIFEVARDMSIAVMIHTGSGLPWGLPSVWIPHAQRFPDVKVVLAHAGMGVFTSEAHLAASLCPNVYLETSWAKPGELLWLIRDLGPQRVMFAADMVSNMAVELYKYRAIGLTQDELEWCLGRTATTVFGLPDADR